MEPPKASGTRTALTLIGIAVLGGAWALAIGAGRRARRGRQELAERRAAMRVHLDTLRARAAALARSGRLSDAARPRVQAALGSYADGVTALQQAATVEEVAALGPTVAAGLQAVTAAGRDVGEEWALSGARSRASAAPIPPTGPRRARAPSCRAARPAAVRELPGGGGARRARPAADDLRRRAARAVHRGGGAPPRRTRGAHPVRHRSEPALRDERLGDLHGVGGGALAQVVARRPTAPARSGRRGRPRGCGPRARRRGPPRRSGIGYRSAPARLTSTTPGAAISRRARRVGGDLVGRLDLDRLGVRVQHRHAHAGGADAQVGHAEHLARLGDDLALLARVAALVERSSMCGSTLNAIGCGYTPAAGLVAGQKPRRLRRAARSTAARPCRSPTGSSTR